PVRAPLANVEREIGFELAEAAGLHDVGDEIGANLGRPAPQLAQPPRRDVDADGGHQQRDYDADGEKGAEQDPRRHAGRVHHDEFGVVAEFVEHVGDRDHQRDRRDDQDQEGNDQAGDADEDEDALALIGHQGDVAQRLG